MTHTLKIWERYANAVLSGEKTFEIRENDRGYQKGDHILFRVMEDGGDLQARSHELNGLEYEITYIHSGLGMDKNYVALSIVPVKTTDVGIVDDELEDVFEKAAAAGFRGEEYRYRYGGRLFAIRELAQ